MKKLLGIVVLGLFVAVQSHAAEKETIVKSLLEQYDKEIASLDGKISKLEKTIETGDLVTTSPLDMGTPVHVEATNDMSEEFTITGQINDSNKPSNIIKKDTNNKQSDPLKTEKAKLESEKIKQDIQSNKYTGRGPPSWREHILSLKANPNDQLEYDKQSDLLKTEKGKLESEKIKQDIQFEIDITKGREVLTEHQKAMYEHLWVEPLDPMDPMDPMEPMEPLEPMESLFKLKEKEKKINQLDPLKTEKAKSESEKIKQDIQDKKNKQLGTIISDSSEYRGKTIVKDPRDLKELQKMFQSAWKDLQPAEKATAKSLGWSESLWKKRKKNIELLKTEKGKLESEKIRLAVQLNKYIDKKNLEQKIIDTQTKTKKKTKTETRKALKKALSELKKAKKKKKILKKKKKVRKKKEVVNRKPVNKKKVIKRKPVKKKKVIKRKPVKKKRKTRKKKEKSKK